MSWIARTTAAQRRAALLSVALLCGLAGYVLWEWPAWRARRDVRRAFATRKYVDAARAANRWVQLRPQSADAQCARAKAAIVQGRRDEVFDALKTARALGSSREQLAVLHALIDAQEGRLAQALPPLARAFNESKGPDPILNEALARVYMDLYDFPHAGAVLDRWTKDVPDDPRPPLWHSIIHRRLASPPDVLLADYQEVLRRDPQQADARLGLADLLASERKYAEAAENYDLYLKIRPNDAAGHVSAGRNDLQRNRTEDAIRHFDLALVADPKNAVAHLEHAKLDLRRGALKDALAHLDRAREEAPNDPIVRYNRSLALKRLGQADESAREHAEFQRLQKDQAAVAALQDRLADSPGDMEAQVELARWMFSHGYDTEGLRWTRKILSETPGQADVCQLLADYYASQGRDDLASAYRDQIRPTQPSRALPLRARN